MCSLAAVSALWLGAAVHDGIQQLKKTPLRMPKTSLKIYSRKVPPSPFPNSTIYSQKLILDEKKHILKYRVFCLFGGWFPHLIPLFSPIYIFAPSETNQMSWHTRLCGSSALHMLQIQDPLSEGLECDGLSPVSLPHLEGQVHPSS